MDQQLLQEIIAEYGLHVPLGVEEIEFLDRISDHSEERMIVQELKSTGVQTSKREHHVWLHVNEDIALPCKIEECFYQQFNPLYQRLFEKGEYRLAVGGNGLAVRLCLAVLGLEHRATLASLNDLMATKKAHLRHPLYAVPLFEYIVGRRRAALGVEHPDTLNSLGGLAYALYCRCRSDEALPMFETVHKVDKARLGDDHPDTISDLANLAMCLEDLDCEEALVLRKQIYERVCRVFRVADPLVLTYLNDLTQSLRKLSRADEALPKYEEAYQRTADQLGLEDPTTLAVLHNWADYVREAVLYNRDALEVVHTNYLTVYKHSKAVLGKEHPDTLFILDEVINLYARLEHYIEALPLYKSRHECHKSLFGDHHPKTISSLHQLACCLRNLCRYEDALPLCEEAVTCSRIVHGDDDSTTNSISFTLTRVVRELLSQLRTQAVKAYEQKQWEEGFDLFVHTRDLARQHLEDDHPDHGVFVNDLTAFVHKWLPVLMERTAEEVKQKLYEEAISTANRACELAHEYISEDQRVYAILVDRLANVYCSAGQYKLAESQYLQALKIFARTVGKEDSHYITSLSSLANLYGLMLDYTKAAALYQQAVKINQRVFGERHPDTVTSLNYLAGIYRSMGDYTQAESLLHRALEIRCEALGEQHPDTATSLNNLAEVYRSRGDYRHAEPLYHQALEIWREVLGEQHPTTATCLNNLAILYHEMGDYAQAEPLYQEALESRRQVLGKTHTDYAGSLSNLAGLYHAMGDYTKAEPHFRQALEIWREALGEGHPDYALGLSNLAVLYDAMGDYARAEPLHRQALEIRREVLGERHPDTVTSLSNLAGLYRSMGDYAQAEPLYQKALEIRREELGARHPDTAVSLSTLAALYASKGDYAQAEPLVQEALEIRREAFGERHTDTATNLDDLALLYSAMGNYAQAEPLYQEALEIRREVLGERHPDTVTSLNNLAGLYRTMGDYAQAEPLYQKALEIRREELGDRHTDTATNLDDLAWLYSAMGNYAQAEPLYQEALVIRREVLGARQPGMAMSLNSLAGFYYQMGDYAQAEPLYQEALAIAREMLGERHPGTATCLNNLAMLHQSMGDYAQAEPLYQKALEVRREELGVRHPDTAASLSTLAELYASKGDYAQAEALYQEALDIRCQVLGKQHPDTATCLNNLAYLYESMGDYTQAEALYQEAMKISRETLGERHTHTAASLSNLAALYISMGDYTQAEPLCRQALEVIREALGERHPTTAASLNILGVLYEAKGDYTRAEPLYQEALVIRREVLGARHPDMAVSLNNLAGFYHQMGDYARAEPLYQETLAIMREALGERHPHTAQSLNNLAKLLVSTGKATESLNVMRVVADIHSQLISQIFSMGSERQRAAYLKSIHGNLEVFLSLVSAHVSDSAEAVRAALQFVLQRKALGAEALGAQRDAVLGGQYPELKSQIEALTVLRRQIAQKVLAGPGAEGLDHHQQLASEWTAEKERLEAELARAIPEMQLEQQLQSADLGAVALHIPENGILVEFVRFNEYDFHAVPAKGEQHWKSPRYIAFVVPAGENDTVCLIDLGEAAAIDGLIAQFRAQITQDPNEFERRGLVLDDGVKAAEQAPGETLRRRIFDPLTAHLGESHHLFLAPDGELTRLPFEVLPTDEGYLLDNYAINYVGTGRDVLRFGAKASGAASESLVVADPNFDLSQGRIPKNQTLNPPVGESGLEATVAARHPRELSPANMHFSRLPGTRVEGERVGARLGVIPWMDKHALETPLKNQHSPQILHLSTHGFFLEYQPTDPNAGDQFRDTISWGDDGSTIRFLGPEMANPLLRSGLALAGVNTWLKHGALPAEAEDGLLTAEDVSGLDLLNTELVVLSACETGLGEIHVGEGVYGLRRAFVLAGAKTLIMSLWKVPDFVTAILMDRLYENLLERRLPRDESLREAQRYVRDLTIGELHEQWFTNELIEQFSAGNRAIARQLRYLVEQPDDHCPFSHPLYWGAFICQGETAPLSDPHV